VIFSWNRASTLGAEMTISQRLPGSPALARASLGSLLYEFLKVSFLGFGGGIVLAHRAAVERRRWLTEGDFTG
jgi:hypothetical protein